ncbi:MAG: glycosyltransferase [Capsulimonadaceae bacterium]
MNSTDLSGWRGVALAVDETRTSTAYQDPRVVFIIEKEAREDYCKAARVLSDQRASLLCIQHEYGIYGGDHGEYVIDLARAAEIPVVVTLHTVLPNPSGIQRRIIEELNEHAAAFVVMAMTAVPILIGAYGISHDKIHVIPHGAPVISISGVRAAKEACGLTGRRVLSTFGLMSSDKGIEDAIAAMPAIVQRVPNVVYLVLGQTHPVIKRRDGESYRDSLRDLVIQLGLCSHIEFVDRYLTLQDLVCYLQATDVYITPRYSNPHQITSGTLAYAIAAGNVIVSTPYLYAEELLANGRGFLYPFRDVAALAEIVGRLLTDAALLEDTRRLAVAYSQAMAWPNVGHMYAKLFNQLLQESSVTGGAISVLRANVVEPGKPTFAHVVVRSAQSS